MNNYGQDGGTAHADIAAPEAWDVLTSASNIVVAVLDSGIRATHEDLAANMWVNPHYGGHGFKPSPARTIRAMTPAVMEPWSPEYWAP